MVEIYPLDGNLDVTGYIAAKTFVSLRVATSGGTPWTSSTIGTVGPTSLSYFGSRRTSLGCKCIFYSFTLPTAHPLGANYIANGGFRTGSSSDPSPNAFLSFSVTSSTVFNIWVRSSKTFY